MGSAQFDFCDFFVALCPAGKFTLIMGPRDGTIVRIFPFLLGVRRAGYNEGVGKELQKLN